MGSVIVLPPDLYANIGKPKVCVASMEVEESSIVALDLLQENTAELGRDAPTNPVIKFEFAVRIKLLAALPPQTSRLLPAVTEKFMNPLFNVAAPQ